MKKMVFGLVCAAVGALNISGAWADPTCMYNATQAIGVNNTEVLYWRDSPQVPNGFQNRANVTGVVLGIYPDATGHNHFLIQIGPNSTDELEVVYNEEFGALPQITRGMQVHACGDFVKSDAPFNGYQASPAGALVHWIHATDTPNHPGGFLELDGVVYGQDLSHDPGHTGHREW